MRYNRCTTHNVVEYAANLQIGKPAVYPLSNYAFVYPRTSDFELGAKFESGVETEILVRVGLELPLDQNSF